MNQPTGIPVPVVFALGFTMMLGPFAIDTYLPAFPLIADDFGVSIHAVSLSISIYLLGIAVGQLTGGALSDRYGRRRVLITGLCVFAAASFFLSQVSSLNLLLLGRLAQAIGGGWIAVSIPALVRDQVHGVQAAKLFSLIGMVSVIAPAIAPAIGAALLAFGAWNIVFVFLGLYALLLLPLLSVTVFRGPRKPRAPADGVSMLARYLGVLRTRSALPYVGWQAASFGGLMIFVTYASFIYQGHYAQSRSAFALLFACNIFAMFSCNLLNRWLLNRHSPQRIMAVATCVQALSATMLLVTALADWPVYAFLPAMMVYAGTLGAISPNLQACFLEYFPTSSASAAAVLGAAQSGFSGLAGGFSNLLPQSLLSVTSCIALCAAASASCMLWSRRENLAAERTGT